MIGELTFQTPPPGLAPATRFALREVDGAPGLFSMEAEADAGVRLFVVDPSVYAPHYRPAPAPAQLADLGLDDVADATVLVVAHAGAAGTTLNLLAPLIIDPSTGRSAQVILEGDWPLRHPLGAHESGGSAEA